MYPIGSYAPGDYFCECRVCGKRFDGDKRATQCEKCATEETNRQTQYPGLKMRSIRLTDEEYEKVKAYIKELREEKKDG